MKVRDMTKGNPFSLIIRFALPLFVGNIFQQIYSIVDTVIAGYKLGDSAIAAIGATGAIYGLLINFAVGLNNGFAIVVSKYFGARNDRRLKESIAWMIILNLIVSFSITIVCVFGIDIIMKIMNVPSSIYSVARSYILIIISGITITVTYNMLSGILRAVGNSLTPLYFLIVACLLNVVLDYIFVFKFNLGVKGTAIATVIAQLLSASLTAVFLIKNYKAILPKYEHFNFNRDIVSELMSNGLAMSLMYCFVDIGTVIFQRSINTLGSTLITAHVTARRIIGIFSMPLGLIASANATFVSQNYGAKSYDRIKKSLLQVNVIEIVWSLFALIIVILFGKNIVVLLTNTKDVVMIDKSFINMLCHFICTPFVGVLLVLRTTLQAMGIKRAPIYSSSMELLIKIVAGFYLIDKFGYIVVCLTEPFIWIVCMTYLVLYFVIKKPFLKMNKLELLELENKKMGIN